MLCKICALQGNTTEVFHIRLCRLAGRRPAAPAAGGSKGGNGMSANIRDYAKLAAEIRDQVGEQNIVSAAHCASFIRPQAPTKWNAHLAESNFQTRSNAAVQAAG